MIDLRVNIDVDDLDRGIEFYTQALGLKVGRRLGGDWAELLGGATPIDLLAKPSGSATSPASKQRREYVRHWTPVHLDFVVADLDAAVRRAEAAGAALEGEIRQREWGRMANMADPFGHPTLETHSLLEFPEIPEVQELAARPSHCNRRDLCTSARHR